VQEKEEKIHLQIGQVGLRRSTCNVLPFTNRWTGGDRDPVLHDLVIQGPEDLGHALLGILLTVPPPLTNLVKLREILA